jgi:thioredoxin-related protein
MKHTIPFYLATLAMLTQSATAQEGSAKNEAAPAVKTAEQKTGNTSMWTEDFEAAKATAAKDKKDILMDFTGSDWCGWCIKLKKEVFDKAEFAKAAGGKFVFMEVDFPQEKKQDEKVKAQNAKLQETFKVEGYPSIVLTDAEGRAYAQTGYQPGGPAAYLTHLDELREVRVKRDEAMAKAAKLEGLDKAKALKEALDTMDSDLVKKHYGQVTEEILGLDKEDSLGLKKEHENDKAMETLNTELEQLAQAGKLDEFSARIDKFIADQKLEGEKKQSAMMMKLAVLGVDKLDAAEKLVEEVIKVDEKSETAGEAKGVMDQIKNIRAQMAAEKKEDKPQDKKKEKSE